MKELIGRKSILLLAVPLVLAACSEPVDNNDVDVQVTEDTLAGNDQQDNKTFYQVPAPDEMFVFIKEAGGTGKASAPLNNPDNFNAYNEQRKKALNFGIYSTDLLYCSTFDLGNEVMKYFAVVKKMGDDLGVSSAITERETQRIDQSIGNNDSLVAVANDIYYNTYQTLEQNDQGKVLAQMVAGGWIESLFLVTSMNPEYKEGNELFQRVADQKLTLENLISYLEKYSDDAGVQQTIAQLNDLQSVYAGLETEKKGETKVDQKNGKMVLGGGSEINMTPDQYKALAAKIAEIRNNFTSTNS